MERAGLKILFIPHSTNRGGTGEYIRCLIIAKALKKRWPGVRIDFVIHGDAPYAASHPWPAHTFYGYHKEKKARDERNRMITSLIVGTERPDLVIFDGAGRWFHFMNAFRKGIPIAFIATKPGVIRKGFTLLRIIAGNQLWIMQHVPGVDPISAWRRRLASLFGIRIVEFSAIYTEPDQNDQKKILEQMGLSPAEKFILFIPGGGTYRINGRSVVDIFRDAAERVSQRTGMRCIVVGARPGGQGDRSKNLVSGTEFLENRQLIALMRGASICVCGGGNMISQPMANGIPVVSVPLKRPDQLDRVSKGVDLGILVDSEPEPETIACTTMELISNEKLRMELIERVADLHITNGIDAITDAVKGILG